MKNRARPHARFFYGVLRTTEWLTTFLSWHIVQTAIGFREHPVVSYERRMK